MTQLAELADAEVETVRKLFRKHEHWHGLDYAERSIYRKLWPVKAKETPCHCGECEQCCPSVRPL
jgi:hypothetical protein